MENIISGIIFSYAVKLFCNFSTFFLFFHADLAIRRKILGYTCKIISSGYKNYVLWISYIIFSSFRPILEMNWCQVIFVFLFKCLLSVIFATFYQCSSYEKKCLLSTINYRPVSTDINVETVCIINSTVASIISSWSILSL